LEFSRRGRNPRKGAPERANLTFSESIKVQGCSEPPSELLKPPEAYEPLNPER